MSMSTYVQGLMEKDEKFIKMESILLQCRELKIKPPKEVEEYFDYESDGYCEQGIIVSLPDGVVKHYTDYTDDIWEVDISKIPNGVEKIRFINSY